MCISVSQLVRIIGIAVYAGISVFSGIYSSIRSPFCLPSEEVEGKLRIAAHVRMWYI